MATTFHKSKSDSDDHRRLRCCSSSPLCKRHPKHRQSPGVCSLCLTEKLSRIPSATSSSSSSSSRKVISDSLSSSNSSSYYSSASSCSSCSSPKHPNYDTDRRRRRGGRNKAADFAASIFKKSRSMRILRGGGGGGDKKSSNKLGFWSRILNRPPARRMELTHSRTTTVVLQRNNVHG